MAGSRSSANPSNPLYLPIIARDADIDVPSTQAPDLVTEFRAYAAVMLGSASFTATVAGSVLTFANTATNNALLKSISEDALVQRWLSSGQSATYAASFEDFANGRCINVAGIDYAIAGINLGARTLTVTGTPTAGSQTVIFYPYRIAGLATSVRLHKLTGFVAVAAGDADGQYMAAMRVMDRGQGHWHQIGIYHFGSFSAYINPGVVESSVTSSVAIITTEGPVTDTVNGTPRTGKNTDARAHSVWLGTWARRLLT